MQSGALARIRYISDSGGRNWYRAGESGANVSVALDLQTQVGPNQGGSYGRKPSSGATVAKKAQPAKAASPTPSAVSTTADSGDDDYLESGGPQWGGLSSSGEAGPPAASQVDTVKAPEETQGGAMFDSSDFPDLQPNAEDVKLAQRIKDAEERQINLLKREQELEEKTKAETEKIEARVKTLRERLNVENNTLKLRDRREHPCSKEEQLVLNCLRRQSTDVLKCGRFVDEFNLCAARAAQ